MNERPILFSAPMVHAILAGRKTQTRRVAKPRRRCSLLGMEEGEDGVWRHAWTDGYILDPGNREWLMREAPCQPGDTLWVREAWRADVHYDPRPPRELAAACAVFYEAGGGAGDGVPGRLRASMHMPRWASRITLRCTDVRVERLNDCSWEDAIAEGLETSPDDDELYLEYGTPSWDDKGVWLEDPRRAYRALWETINGEGAWAKNPLVWALSFEVVTKP